MSPQLYTTQYTSVTVEARKFCELFYLSVFFILYKFVNHADFQQRSVRHIQYNLRLSTILAQESIYNIYDKFL